MSVEFLYFPLTQANRLTGGGGFSTDITVGKSGHESRNANWQDALWKFNAAFSVKSREDAITLRNFHLVCHGKEKAFLLQAADDYKIPDSGSTPQNIGTGDGSDATFQIYKRYTEQGFSYDRIITHPSPTSSDLAVYVNGVLKTHTTHYTYSTSTGIITFTGGNIPPNGHAVTITLAKFYVPVRFDVDAIPMETLLWWVNSGTDVSLHEIPDIPLVEVRV